MLKRVFLFLLPWLVLPSLAFGGALTLTPPPQQAQNTCTYPCSFWKAISPDLALANQNFVMSAVWWQGPAFTSGYSGVHTNQAAAANAMGINTFLGIGLAWPSSFGVESGGELAAIQGVPGEQLIGGIFTDYTSTTSATSIQSVLSLINTRGAGHTDMGFNFGDEPPCGSSGAPPPPWMAQIPAAAATARGYDGSRLITMNFSSFVPFEASNSQSGASGCHAQFIAALNELSFVSFDVYPKQHGFIMRTDRGLAGAHVEGSDFATISADTTYIQGLGIQNLVNYEASNPHGPAPVYGFIAAGNNGLGDSQSLNFFTTDINGTTTITDDGFAGVFPSQFTTALWGGMTISSPQEGNVPYAVAGGLPPCTSTCLTGSIAGTTFTVTVAGNGNLAVGEFLDSSAGVTAGTRITACPGACGGTGAYTINISQTVGSQAFIADWFQANTTISTVTDGTHAVVNHAPFATKSGLQVYCTGGTGGVAGCCVIVINLCGPYGTQYRVTPQEQIADTFENLTAGAYGVLWFCNDLLPSGTPDNSFCLGDPAGGTAATIAHDTTQYINTNILAAYAQVINGPVDGLASMQKADDYTTTTTATSGILKVDTSVTNCPLRARATHANGFEYVIVMTDRRSTSPINCGALAGTTVTIKLTGKSGAAKIVYDSNSYLDPSHDSTNTIINLSGESFSDVIGANGASGQAKIYAIH